jgi:hypothetical protein
MKKNRIIQGIGVVIICIMFTTSCDDAFLDRKPYGDIASDNFYSSEKEIDIAAVGLYGTLQNFYSPHYPSIAELPGDNASDGSGASTATGQLDKFSIIPNNAVLSNAWTNAYRSILQSNKIMEALPDVQFGDDDKKKQIEGEARFARALNYFNLTRMFGKVPLDTMVLSQAQARQSVRNEVTDVYKVIINDLKMASSQLPEAYTGNAIGRATKWAALSLLGKVYLTNYQFSEALEPLQIVIDSGQFILLPDFAEIFEPNNANHAESIFEIQYEGGTLGEGSRWSFTSHPRILSEAMKISAGNSLIPTSDIVDAFGENDEEQVPSSRYSATIGTMSYKGASGNTLNAKHIKKHYMDHTMQNQSDDNWPLLRYADVLLMYAEALNETSGTPPQEAIELVNQIRRRAFGLPQNAISARDLWPSMTADTESFRNAIYLERRLELAFEGHRWFDLIRTGTYQTVMNSHFGSSSPYKVESYHRLFPVPQQEIDINPLLKPNNEGY